VCPCWLLLLGAGVGGRTPGHGPHVLAHGAAAVGRGRHAFTGTPGRRTFSPPVPVRAHRVQAGVYPSTDGCEKVGLIRTHQAGRRHRQRIYSDLACVPGDDEAVRCRTGEGKEVRASPRLPKIVEYQNSGFSSLSKIIGSKKPPPPTVPKTYINKMIKCCHVINR